jgi:hypothetical protein
MAHIRSAGADGRTRLAPAAPSCAFCTRYSARAQLNPRAVGCRGQTPWLPSTRPGRVACARAAWRAASGGAAAQSARGHHKSPSGPRRRIARPMPPPTRVAATAGVHGSMLPRASGTSLRQARMRTARAPPPSPASLRPPDRRRPRDPCQFTAHEAPRCDEGTPGAVLAASGSALSPGSLLPPVPDCHCLCLQFPLLQYFKEMMCLVNSIQN